jgi:hypothetical protein
MQRCFFPYLIFLEDLCLNLMPRKKLCYVSEEFTFLTFTFLVVGQAAKLRQVRRTEWSCRKEIVNKKTKAEIQYIYLFLYTASQRYEISSLIFSQLTILHYYILSKHNVTLNSCEIAFRASALSYYFPYIYFVRSRDTARRLALFNL